MKTQALLLSAGLGTRLKPYTDHLPKALMPIQGQPLIAYWLSLLNSKRISRVAVNIHAHALLMERYLNEQTILPQNKLTVLHEKSPLGTAGTIRENVKLFRDQPLLLIHGDNLSQFSMDDFLDRHESRPKDCLLTMMSFHTDQPENCGILEINRDGKVVMMHEKVNNPHGNRANAAVYILAGELVNQICNASPSVSDFSTEVIPNLFGNIIEFQNQFYHRDIGNPQSLKNANLEWSFKVPKASLPEWLEEIYSKHFAHFKN